jgi:hypothetical protein
LQSPGPFKAHHHHTSFILSCHGRLLLALLLHMGLRVEKVGAELSQSLADRLVRPPAATGHPLQPLIDSPKKRKNKNKKKEQKE